MSDCTCNAKTLQQKYHTYGCPYRCKGDKDNPVQVSFETDHGTFHGDTLDEAKALADELATIIESAKDKTVRYRVARAEQSDVDSDVPKVEVLEFDISQHEEIRPAVLLRINGQEVWAKAGDDLSRQLRQS